MPTSEALAATVGIGVAPNKAIVGANAFAHESGIHQDGMLKHALTYEIMRPESVGAAGTKLVLGKHSGMRGLDARCRAIGHRLGETDLERVYRQGRSKGNRFLVLYAFPREDDGNDDTGPRLGLVSGLEPLDPPRLPAAA